MLFLIVETILTVIAWRKGWRGWALIPIVANLLISFVVGAAIEVSGGYVEMAYLLFLIFDIATVVVLSVLIKKGRRRVVGHSNCVPFYTDGGGAMTHTMPVNKIEGDGFVDVRNDGYRAGCEHRDGGRHVRACRHDHLVTRADSDSDQRRGDRIGSARRLDAVLDADPLGIPLLEPGALAPDSVAEDLSALDHLPHSLELFFPDSVHTPSLLRPRLGVPGWAPPGLHRIALCTPLLRAAAGARIGRR